MGKETAIGWTDATVNFWTGCHKVSMACKYCYMYRDKERWAVDPKIVMRTNDKTFKQALHWKEPKKIFTCSWSDFFIEEADKWRDEAWDIIKRTPQHQWQILTKRPERIKQCLPKDWGEKGYPNVWLGVSIENNAVAYDRLWRLIEIPAAIKFVSAEPLLERVDLLLDKCLTGNAIEHGIDWVIVGGESGHGKVPEDKNVKYRYRKTEIEWIEDVVAQCVLSGVPCFVKQLGTHLAKEMKLNDKTGSDINEFPVHLKHQQFPSLVSRRKTMLENVINQINKE